MSHTTMHTAQLATNHNELSLSLSKITLTSNTEQTVMHVNLENEYSLAGIVTETAFRIQTKLYEKYLKLYSIPDRIECTSAVEFCF